MNSEELKTKIQRSSMSYLLSANIVANYIKSHINIFLKDINYYKCRVLIKNNHSLSHYLYYGIEIRIYRNKENYDNYSHSASIYFNLDELLNTCSTVVLHHVMLNCDNCIFTPIYNKLFTLIEDVCYAYNYSNILVTISEESNMIVQKYVEKNYKLIYKIINKRGRNNVRFYTKDL